MNSFVLYLRITLYSLVASPIDNDGIENITNSIHNPPYLLIPSYQNLFFISLPKKKKKPHISLHTKMHYIYISILNGI
jgi:hypothetical protein